MPALLGRGLAVCTVELPDNARADNQRSAEYVVQAVRTMSARYGSKVDVVAHSQGPVTARWALKWWPDVAARVDDLVVLPQFPTSVSTIDGAANVAPNLRCATTPDEPRHAGGGSSAEQSVEKMAEPLPLPASRRRPRPDSGSPAPARASGPQ